VLKIASQQAESAQLGSLAYSQLCPWREKEGVTWGEREGKVV